MKSVVLMIKKNWIRLTTKKKKRGSVSNLRFENFYIEGAAGGPTIDQNSGNNGRTPCFVRPGGSEKKEVSGTNA